MSIERQLFPSIDTMCRSCPKRGWLRRVLDIPAPSDEAPDDCRGPVVLHHNKIVHKTGDAREVLADHQNQFGEVDVSGDDIVTFAYMALERARRPETQCGREPIVLEDGEYVQDPDADPRPWSDGMRHIALVEGDPTDVLLLRRAIARQGHVGPLSNVNLR